MSKLEKLEPNNVQFGIHRYWDAVIENRSVIIGAGAAVDQFSRVRFVGCDIRILLSGHATTVVFGGNQFADCVIRASKIQKIAKLTARFDRCSFTGRYEVGFYGRVSSCDFSKARLNHGLFFDSEGPQDCTWPGDGHLLISDLAANRDDFRRTVPRMSLLSVMAWKDPKAIVVYKDSLKEVAPETWDALEAKDYVHVL